MLNYNYEGIPLDYFVLKPHAYSQYPPCQRDYVWKHNMQHKLIDSILRGLPIPPVTLLPTNDEYSGSTYWVVDGQQRLETIRKYINNDFPTAKRFRDEPLIKPIAPGKRYFELDDYHRKKFNEYKMQVCTLGGIDDGNIELVYRRLNYQVQLALPERLYSYHSPARIQGERLQEHPFWITVYCGKSDRKQVYQMALMTMLMELYDTYCNMTTSRLVDMASGANIGKNVPHDLHLKIAKRLTVAEHIYGGSDMRGMTHIIPIYQSVMILENDGCDLQKSPSDCFSNWFNEVRMKSLESRTNHGTEDLFTVLTKVVAQQKFWIEQLPKLQNVPGLVYKDIKRSFDALDRLKALIRQKGKCAICKKPVTTKDDGHHIDAYANGGKTASDNCLLVHSHCHKNLTFPAQMNSIEAQVG